MFSSALNTKAIRVTVTGLVAAVLAVCTVSVAPGSAASASTATTSAQPTAVMTSGSGQSTQDDGFHW